MSASAPDLQSVRNLYAEVFAGQTDLIPLIVTPPGEPLPPPRLLVEQAPAVLPAVLAALAPKQAVASDWLPTLNVGWFQCLVVPSFFGAPPVYLEGSEPIVRPCFGNVAEAVDAGRPPVAGPLLEQLLSVQKTLLQLLPEPIALSLPPTASPFDLAQLMVTGEELLISLQTEPELVAVFLDTLADLCAEVLALVRAQAAGTPSEAVTNRGMYFPGTRLACDALVNYSPSLLRRVAGPVLAKLAGRCGRLCIHYCSKPAPSRHVLAGLIPCGDVVAVDTWQGPDAFIGDGAPARLQDRVALVFDTDLSSRAKMASFLAWEPIKAVPRRGGRGLVVQTAAPSVAAGRELYAWWQAEQEAAATQLRA